MQRVFEIKKRNSSNAPNKAAVNKNLPMNIIHHFETHLNFRIGSDETWRENKPFRTVKKGNVRRNLTPLIPLVNKSWFRD
jgi:hypothetical protein